MKQRIMHGATLDFVTPDEMARAIPRPAQVTRIRASAQVVLNASGNGQDEVYKVPTGYEFAARRVSMNLSGITDPSTGQVALSAGKNVAYLRSGTLIEFAQPQYGAAVQVPGVQTWGAEQGPYLRNAEVFEVLATGLTASAILTVVLEGLLRLPSTEPHARHA
jgi:hypothetical protein